MQILKFFRNVAICGFLINTGTAQAMTTWDFHPSIINEYDDVVPAKTANRYFSKFAECQNDRSWCNRNIHGEDVSFRFQASPRLIFDFLKDACSPSTPKLVVDLAGADGRVAELALFTGAKVVLIDRNAAEILEADKRIKETRGLPQDLIQQYQSYIANALTMDEQLPQLQGKVDAIHMSNLLHFFNGEETEKLLNNIHLFLRAGGKIHGAVDSIYATPSATIAKFLENKESGTAHPGIFPTTDGMHNYFSTESLQELFEKFGFSTIKVYYTNSSTLPTAQKESSVKVVFSFEKKPLNLN
ncbi:MAG: class I SAM-dependent methyltransferase [Proteobacteria bacterium]|nr:class I SAM-dependent methyltransferase [Pseudomonadota bacterium]